MMMIDHEEGDVPPGAVVNQTVTGCITAPKHHKKVMQGPRKVETEEFKAQMESYRRHHKQAISKMIPSTYVQVSPLNPQREPEKNL